MSSASTPPTATAQRTVRLIARSNGAGISQDLQRLQLALEATGHRVEHISLGRRRRWLQRWQCRWQRWRDRIRGHAGTARHDINLFVEQLRPELFEQARHNVLMPNPEWFHAEWLPELARVDLILAKTRHAEQIFSALGCRTHWTGFSAQDCRRPEIVRVPDFFHGPGRSGNKGTLPLIELWSRHPEWPMLHIVWRRKHVQLPPLPANIRLYRDYLEEAELRRLQNGSVFHLCPSQTEGYGHSLAEAMSCGAVTITCDAEPMNELVGPDRGVLVATVAGRSQALARLHDFQAESMEAAIERCIRMSEPEQRQLGEAARQWYEAAVEQFPHQLAAALDSLHEAPSGS
ncbi:glycosyltransferase [Frateuria aurantia]|uniref:Glycosyltransferase n=1 Tax=Frateuria aurantia (strain ATCC 33424 / DSM 6220 / KCTC 2777 / LMG 1558 / NBRC 3245 / NCIMB 13370) TaxID=767434 RepID=H8L3P2_FRAAD|nr:glycosyltransferase [Frateuria aurantia]AFC87411.1 glycosyltransferase [Frateuria aurantia DSM 6220]